MTIRFGTFLLMQSPSAPAVAGDVRAGDRHRPGGRGARLPQRLARGASLLDLRLSLAAGPVRDVHRGEDHAAPGGHRRHRGSPPPPARGRRGDRDPRPAGRRPGRHRARAGLPALRVRAARARAGQRARALGRVGRRHSQGVRRRAVHLRRQVLQDPRDVDLPPAAPEAAPAHLGHGAEPGIGGGRRAPRLQRAHGRLRRADRADGGVPPALRPPGGGGPSRRTRWRSASSAPST